MSAIPLSFWLTTAIVLGAAVAVYLPGLRGEFLFDDIPNLFQNQALQQLPELGWSGLWETMTSGITSSTGRPVAMLSFGLNALHSGLDPFHLKLTNLAIHLVNGLFVYRLTRRLLAFTAAHTIAAPRRGAVHPELRVAWVALGIAALWLLHPLNLTSVLYAVQRMTSLAALFTLLGLLAYLRGRLLIGLGEHGASAARGAAWIAFAYVGCLPLAVMSKENGILLPVFIGLVEWLILRFEAPTARAERALRWLMLATVVLPAIAAAGYLVLHPGWVLDGYAHRPFTFGERLLTEPRVLWFYLRLVLLPDWRAMGLHHDDLALSHGLLTPPTTLPALLALALLVVLAFAARLRWPLLGFGVLFFLAGHMLESTVIALEIVHEHRNYLPGYGLLLAAAGSLWQWQIMRAPRWHAATASILTLAVALCAWQTAQRAASWADNLRLAVTEAKHHPGSARSLGFAGFQVLRQAHAFDLRGDKQRAAAEIEQARLFFDALRRRGDEELGSLYGLLSADALQGRRPDPGVLAELAERLRSGKLPSSGIGQLAMLSQRRTAGLDTNLADPGALSTLFDAILDNPNLRGSTRASIARLAQEHAETVGDEALRHKAATRSEH